MSRSSKRSLTVPHPVREGLQAHLDAGVIDYPSENAAWVGLARYHLLCGKSHPLTEPIARMHPEDQDVIDDFLLEVAQRGLNIKGRFLDHLVRRVLDGKHGADASNEVVTRLLPHELLAMAKQWKRGESVLEFDREEGAA